MRLLVLSVALLTTTIPCLAATYTPSQAAAHIGQSATVEGTVSQTHVDDKSGAGFLDMGGRFPNQAFQGFISRRDIGKFGNIERYEGKTVSVTGTIRDYQGTPEIIISDPGQLKTK